MKDSFFSRLGRASRLLFSRSTVLRIPQGGGYPSIPPTGGLNQWSPEVWDPRTLHQKLQSRLYYQRQVSRNLFQESPMYRRFVLQSLTQVVGSQPLLFEFPQLSDGARQELKEKWVEWQTRPLSPRGQTLSELLKSVLYHRIIDGDCLVRVLPKMGRGTTKFVVYPGDAFAERHSGMKEDLGVEMGPYAEPVAYWVWGDYFNGDTTSQGRGGRAERLLPAIAWHFFETDHDAGVLRGHPHAHAVLYLLEQLRLYEDAMITRMKRQAQPYVALKQLIAGGAPSLDGSVQRHFEQQGYGGRVDNPDAPASSVSSPAEFLRASQPVDNGFGKQFVVPTGYDPVQIATGHTSGEDVPFLRQHYIKMIAAGLGVSDITLASGFDQANFSSAQMASLGEIELWRRWQVALENKVVRKIWPVFLNEVKLDGVLSAADMGVLFGDQRKFPSFNWRRVQVLEAHRMVGALKQGVDGGIYTVREARESLGLAGNFKDFAQERAEEKDILDQYGLKPPGPPPPNMPPNAPDSGENQPDSGEESEENEPDSDKKEDKEA